MINFKRVAQFEVLQRCRAEETEVNFAVSRHGVHDSTLQQLLIFRATLNFPPLDNAGGVPALPWPLPHCRRPCIGMRLGQHRLHYTVDSGVSLRTKAIFVRDRLPRKKENFRKSEPALLQKRIFRSLYWIIKGPAL